MEGFFSPSEARTSRPLPTLIPRCGHCRLFESCKSPKMAPTGDGRKRIMIVGEYPGLAEDTEGIQLVGKMGQYLERELTAVGINMRRDCVLTNASICAGARDHKSSVEDCRPNLLKAIEKHQPRAILLLGTDAVRSLIGHVWKSDVGAISRWVGWKIPCHKPNAWLFPANDPAWFLREPSPVAENEFRRILSDLVAVSAVPWPDGPPSYEEEVELIYNLEEAAERIRRYTDGRIAFDFETNCLKPDSRKAEIVCASVCWNGTETIAFPVRGVARQALIELLEDSAVEKVGWNCFSGDTKFLTRDSGVVAFSDVCGQSVTVLNHQGRWVDGVVKCFGEQETVQVSFARRNYINTVRATDGHRWIMDTGGVLRTDELRRRRYGTRNGIADSVPYLNAPKLVHDFDDYLLGIRHGIVYGDGTKRKDRSDSYGLRLCGEKLDDLLVYFDGFSCCYPPSYNGDVFVTLTKRGVEYKELPSEHSSDSYLIGFFRGLLATDGCVSNRTGQISYTGTKELIEWSVRVLPKVGYWFQGVTDLSKYKGRYAGQCSARPSYTISLSRESISIDDLLRNKHRCSYRDVVLGSYKFSEFGERRRELVYCVVVPDGESFTLDGGLVTGNCKFEDRWVRRKLQTVVRGWYWDGMLAAHALDPRSGITGLKFQSFVKLGAPNYTYHIEPFLESSKKGGYEINRVTEIKTEQLLRYCGLDSLLEYRVSQIQMQELGDGNCSILSEA